MMAEIIKNMNLSKLISIFDQASRIVLGYWRNNTYLYHYRNGTISAQEMVKAGGTTCSRLPQVVSVFI